MDPTAPLAAVDLGSNSFHMVIGRELGGQVSILDRLRDPVRLRAGLGQGGVLSREALERALACLERFRQRLVEVPHERIRAVATHTFRHTKRPRDLLEQCRAALGAPIEILPGPEEARLVYLGVTFDLGPPRGRRLLVDIGGGSTECILGQGSAPRYTDSLGMGCVSYSLRYFPGGVLTQKGFTRAEIAARLELEGIRRQYRSAGWDEAVGSSGTVRAIEEVLRLSGLGEVPMTLRGVKRLRKELVRRGHVEALADLPGLARERAPVLPGGLAILEALFQSFEVQALATAEYSLREGVLYDLVGRFHHEDVREGTIRSLSERYHVDLQQAERVERTALFALAQVEEAWRLEPELSRQLLSWAARLHEVGLAVAYSGYHRHGGYLLANTSMPGFSREEQMRLATLVRCHRRKLAPELFEALTPEDRELVLRLCVLLRLAVRLERARSPRRTNVFQLRGRAAAFELVFPPGWLAEHTLVRADLEDEASLLAGVGLELDLH